MDTIDLDDFPELATARKLWSEGRVMKALDAFQFAAQSRPANVRCLVEFAKALGLQHEIYRADALLEQALQISSGHTRADIVIAQTLRSIYRPQRALDVLEPLLQSNQLPPPVVAELAVLYEQFGKYDVALETINRCVTVAPNRSEPKRIQARILRRLQKYDQAEQTLNQLAEETNAPPMQSVGVWTELCYLHDSLGNFELALSSIERAKDVLRALPGTQKLIQQSRVLNQTFARLYEQIDEKTLARWIDSGNEQESESQGVQGIAHLLGFPRTGTTLLEQVLDAHPMVTCAPERVIFSKLIFPRLCSDQRGQQSITMESLNRDELDRDQPSKLNKLAAEYIRLHGEVHGQSLNKQILIDKNPNHTSLIAGLLRVVPSSRFISVRRDPRDVLISCYLRTFPLTEYSVAFLDWERSREMFEHEQRILDRMKRLLGTRWIEVEYEAMVDDLHSECDRVVEHLGLAADSATDDYLAATQEKVVNSPTQADVRRPVYKNRVGRWKNYEPFLPI